MKTRFHHSYRIADNKDVGAIFELYKLVSKEKGGLARTSDEITLEYVENFCKNAAATGVQLVLEDQNSGQILGEIHTYRLVPKVFHHILSELTIAVHPSFQGQGIGRILFEGLLQKVQTEHPEILRIELIARESNHKAITFYQTLGFEIEGKFRNRIKADAGSLEADIPMAWLRK